MLILKGEVKGILSYPARGERDEFHQVQILTHFATQNGIRHELVNLTINDPNDYALDTHVEIPVGVYARGNTVRFFTAQV